ncbi:MAG TPA: hypothetical protein VH372_23695 [Actinospica sp.]|nr:hypothetical protein [Actinospica sp.]
MGSSVTRAARTDQDAAADLADWLGGHLAPLTVLGVGATELAGEWSAVADLSHHLVCDPLASAAGGRGEDRTVLAVAVSPHGGQERLNVTRRPERSSLLEPNRTVLARYGGSAEFEVVDRRAVATTTPIALAREHGGIDVLRVDAGGCEYELLSAALPSLGSTVCVEVAGGLVENYVGQYAFGIVAALLHGAGFTLTDLACTGRPESGRRGRVQPLEYRGRWLREPVVTPGGLSFQSAIKLLVLAQRLGHLAFARRLAAALRAESLLPERYHRVLRHGGWQQLDQCSARG